MIGGRALGRTTILTSANGSPSSVVTLPVIMAKGVLGSTGRAGCCAPGWVELMQPRASKETVANPKVRYRSSCGFNSRPPYSTGAGFVGVAAGMTSVAPATGVRFQESEARPVGA